jgi:thiamine-phosphate pyrophosphorylase
VSRVAAALDAGVSLVQYRAKEGHDLQRLDEARALADLCRRHQALFIVNDRIDLALLVDADGVHLGQEDLPSREARALIGSQRLLGRSTHQLDQLLSAQREGCDYVGVGPVYATATKPDRTARGLAWVEEAGRHATIPWFAIGGIDATRLDAVRAAGASRVAVVRAIMEAGDAHGASHDLLTALS